MAGQQLCEIHSSAARQHNQEEVMNHHSSHVTGARAVSPQTLVQQALDDAEGDKEVAATALLKTASVLQSLSDYLLLKGARAALGELVRSDNARIYSGNPQSDVTTAKAWAPNRVGMEVARQRAIGAGRANVRALLSAFLPNGVAVAAAMRADIRHAIDTYQPQATDMMQKVEYFKAIYARLPEDKKCSDVFTDSDLTVLLDNARK